MERHLYNYTYLAEPFERIVGILEAEAADVLAEATSAAVAQANVLVGTMEARLGAFTIGRDVRIDVGPWQPLGARTIKLPLRWRAAEHPAIFPAMVGQLEVTALSSHPAMTQVTFVGHYRPPVGLIGALGDALIGHRIAEASVHWFLEAVCAGLTAQIAADTVSLLD